MENHIYDAGAPSRWERAMQAEEWNLETKAQDGDEYDVAKFEDPEESTDRFGINLSLLILCVALFIASLWAISGPSFEKCSALSDVTQRNACYSELRNEFMKPPAKGGEMPAG
jgi:hypothetical protein